MLAKDPSAKVALGGITGLTAGCCILGVQYIEGLIQRGVAFDYAGIHAYASGSPPRRQRLAYRPQFSLFATSNGHNRYVVRTIIGTYY
jgi:hypothetical protein